MMIVISGTPIEILAKYSLCVSGISLFITTAQLTEIVRMKASNISYWVGELLGCWFCLSFWLSLLAVIIFSDITMRDSLVIWPMSCLVSSIIRKE